jgi:hypothetical protein
MITTLTLLESSKLVEYQQSFQKGYSKLSETQKAVVNKTTVKGTLAKQLLQHIYAERGKGDN